MKILYFWNEKFVWKFALLQYDTLLAKFGMMGDSKVKVPMAFGTKLTPSLEKPAADVMLYRQMIGSLMYLTASRPEFMFSVCYYARF